MSEVRIIVMAKAPVPGFAKTRLIPALGRERAAQLAQRMLLHTLREARTADLGSVELCVTPDRGNPLWTSVQIPQQVAWSRQVEGDLGVRLAHAAEPALASGGRVLLVGTDCPALEAADFQKAAGALEGHDAVLRPTADGGYALLGLRRFHASLFAGIPWSTREVARITLERIGLLRWSVWVGAVLHDIDEPGDLRWLPSELREFANLHCKNSTAPPDCTTAN